MDRDEDQTIAERLLKELGQNLQETRLGRDELGRELAAEFGFEPSMVSKIESGATPLPWAQIEAFARYARKSPLGVLVVRALTQLFLDLEKRGKGKAEALAEMRRLWNRLEDDFRARGLGSLSVDGLLKAFTVEENVADEQRNAVKASPRFHPWRDLDFWEGKLAADTLPLVARLSGRYREQTSESLIVPRGRPLALAGSFLDGAPLVILEYLSKHEDAVPVEVDLSALARNQQSLDDLLGSGPVGELVRDLGGDAPHKLALVYHSPPTDPADTLLVRRRLEEAKGFRSGVREFALLGYGLPRERSPRPAAGVRAIHRRPFGLANGREGPELGGSLPPRHARAQRPDPFSPPTSTLAAPRLPWSPVRHEDERKPGDRRGGLHPIAPRRSHAVARRRARARRGGAGGAHLPARDRGASGPG